MSSRVPHYRPPGAGRATRRLGVYFLGVAIGLVLVGLLFQVRMQLAGSGQGASGPGQGERTPD